MYGGRSNRLRPKRPSLPDPAWYKALLANSAAGRASLCGRIQTICRAKPAGLRSLVEQRIQLARHAGQARHRGAFPAEAPARCAPAAPMPFPGALLPRARRCVVGSGFCSLPCRASSLRGSSCKSWPAPDLPGGGSITCSALRPGTTGSSNTISASSGQDPQRGLVVLKMIEDRAVPVCALMRSGVSLPVSPYA